MTKKKGKFLTFIFSLLPGAAHMYMGFMKQGVTLMGLFFFTFFMASWLNVGPLMFLVPIVWFYAFFDANNKNSLDDVEFYTLEDNYLFNFDDNTMFALEKVLHGKGKLVLAIVLILIGINMIWKNIYYYMYGWLPSFIRNFMSDLMYRIPQLIIGVFIILLGVYLIRGKKNEFDKTKRTYKEYPSLSDHDKEL